MKKIVIGIFVCLLSVGVRADEFDDVLAENDINFDDYYIETPDSGDIECSLDTVSLNAGAVPLPVADFDIAGIMLGMDFDEVKFIATVDGLYTERPKNSVVYSMHPDWKYNLDYECRRQKIYAPAQLEQCINSLARNRGVLYASELHLVRDITGETIDVFFTSNATDNVVWKVVYKNDTDEIEGDAEKFENQRDKKTMYWWQNVVEKYGVRAFALEADYGGCEAANRYIHGGAGTAQGLRERRRRLLRRALRSGSGRSGSSSV